MKKAFFTVLILFILLIVCLGYFFHYLTRPLPDQQSSERPAATKTIDQSENGKQNEVSERTIKQSKFPTVMKFLLFLLLIILMAVLVIYLFRMVPVKKKSDPITRKDLLTVPTYALSVFIILFLIALLVPAVHKTILLMLTDQTWICQFIIIIMVTGLFLNTMQYFNLREEYRTFLKIESLFADIDLKEEKDPLKKIDSIMQDHSMGILREKWHNLKTVFHDISYIDIDSLLSFPDHREFLKESKLSFIIKILPLLGIIGTVLGFVVSIVGMREAAANMSDFASFKGDMLDALGGMQTAFLTTLTGIAGMIIVMFVNSLISESRKRILLQEDEFFYLHIFIPLLSNHHQEKASKTE